MEFHCKKIEIFDKYVPFEDIVCLGHPNKQNSLDIVNKT